MRFAAKSALAALAVLAAGMALPSAASAHGPEKAVASVAGLDLSDPRDGEILLARIQDAARTICVQPKATKANTTAGCVRLVTADTVKRLNLPVLTLALQNPPRSATLIASR